MQHRNVTIEREELNGTHEFVLRIDGERSGFLEFTRPEVGVMCIEHVEVSLPLRGSGLGLQLVRESRGVREGREPASGSDLLVRPGRDRARSRAPCRVEMRPFSRFLHS